MKPDIQFTKLTADLLGVTRGFCEYGESKGLLTPDGLRFAVTKRVEVVKQLTKAGKSQREIATLLGIGTTTVNRDLRGSVPKRNGSVPKRNTKSEAWTDEEIEADIGGKLATPEEAMRLDFLGIAEMAMRVETLDLSQVKPTPEMKTAAKAVVKTWASIVEKLK